MILENKYKCNSIYVNKCLKESVCQFDPNICRLLESLARNSNLSYESSLNLAFVEKFYKYKNVGGFYVNDNSINFLNFESFSL